MKLSIHKRTAGKKGETNRLRREGNIPAVIYGQNQQVQSVFVKKEEISTILRSIKPGLLATTVFELHEGSKTQRAVVKEIQYHVTSYAVEHIDFAFVSDENPVTVNVPIQVVGVSDCVGVKLGGFVRQPVRAMKVSCLPKDIPQQFIVDVRDMEIAQSKRLSDIPLPAGVKPLAKMDQVAIVVAKKAGS